MKFGYHVSGAKPLSDAPLRARGTCCEVFQMFTRSPRGGNPEPLSKEIIAAFAENMTKAKQERFYVHAPYFINFASTNSRIRYGSVSIIAEDLERADALGATAYMTHLGSAKDMPMSKALAKTAEGITKALARYTGKTQFCMELSAGAGAIIGSTFDQLAAILKAMPKKTRDCVGVCLDTCHAYASGYDIRTKALVNGFIKEFDEKIGIAKLAVLHGNDSMFGLGEKKDRHEHIGDGAIGPKGFHAIIHHPKLKDVDMVLETPEGGKHAHDIVALKELRAAKTI